MAHKCLVPCIHSSSNCENARTGRRGRWAVVRAARRGWWAGAVPRALVLVVVMLAAAGLGPAGPARAASSPGLAAIPARYLTWYRAAARTCAGLSWEVLAGIGTMESNNGRSNARGVHKGKNRMGAEG